MEAPHQPSKTVFRLHETTVFRNGPGPAKVEKSIEKRLSSVLGKCWVGVGLCWVGVGLMLGDKSEGHHGIHCSNRSSQSIAVISQLAEWSSPLALIIDGRSDGAWPSVEEPKPEPQSQACTVSTLTPRLFVSASRQLI